MSHSFSREERMAFLYLICCGIQGETAQESALKGIDLEKVFRISRMQQLTALAFASLENEAWVMESQPELYKKWKTAKEKAVRKVLLLSIECDEICRLLEENKIWHMPLKGYVVKNYYPELGMRQMSDQDILIDADGANTVRDIFLARNYETFVFAKGVHDTYHKVPVLNFEMHRALFGAAHQDKWVNYYKDVKERLVKDEGWEYRYHFSDEDFYIYQTLHAFKHFDGSGTGLRSLLDCYVYCLEKQQVMNWEYISTELEKLGILTFETQCRTLAYKVFGGKRNLSDSDIAQIETAQLEMAQLESGEKEMLDFFLGAGVYGSKKIRMGNEIERIMGKRHLSRSNAKKLYLLRRLFPDMKWFEINEPFVYKHKILIPPFYVFRIFKGILTKRKMIRKEINDVREH